MEYRRRTVWTVPKALYPPCDTAFVQIVKYFYLRPRPDTFAETKKINTAMCKFVWFAIHIWIFPFEKAQTEREPPKRSRRRSKRAPLPAAECAKTVNYSIMYKSAVDEAAFQYPKYKNTHCPVTEVAIVQIPANLINFKNEKRHLCGGFCRRSPRASRIGREGFHDSRNLTFYDDKNFEKLLHVVIQRFKGLRRRNLTRGKWNNRLVAQMFTGRQT